MWTPLRCLVIALAAVALAAQSAAARLPTEAPLATVSSTVETRSFVSRLDPLTLAPRGTRVELEEYHDGWSFSPDGRWIAFGKSPAGGNSRDGIRIVDIARLSLVQTVPTNIFVGPLAWVAPNRLVGLLAGNAPALFDPLSGSLLGRPAGAAAAGCASPPAVPAPDALVGLGTRGLFAIDGAGRIRRARLARELADCVHAGLALDASRRHALVLGGDRLAIVDLQSMHARVSRLRGPTPPSRYVNQLVPLPGGSVAVAHTSSAGPRGIELVDTSARTRRTIDPSGGGVRLAAGTLLAFDGANSFGRQAPAIGVRGYDLRGRRRFALLGGQIVSDVEVSGGFAYAIGPAGVSVIDVRAGRVVHRSSAVRDVDIHFLSRAPNAR